MDDFEARLRADAAVMIDPIDPIDPDATVGTVMARGRRRRSVRRAALGFAAIGLLVGGLASATGSPASTMQVDSVDSNDPDESEPPSSTPSTTAEQVPDSTSTTLADSTATPHPRPPTTDPAPNERRERVELVVEARTDASRYDAGAPVTVEVRACNTADRDAVEYFPDPDTMFRLRIEVADEDRTIALGTHPRDAAVQTWKPGECRDYSMVWDQREGDFDDPGQMAWPGEHVAAVDWFSVDPPPDGMDPGLYDPVLPERSPARSPRFTIEPPNDDTEDPGVLGGL